MFVAARGMAHYVDLHCHFLPALDDGARTPTDGLQILAALAGLGFGTVHATPHQRAAMFLPSREAIDDAFATMSVEARAAVPALTLGLAAENFWDDVLYERLGKGGLPAFGAGKAFLFEV